MSLFRGMIALLLLAAALVLAAGCTGENPVLPQGKYVFLKHSIDTSTTTLSGTCPLPKVTPADSFGGPPLYSFDEGKGTLSVYMSSAYQVNASLVLFYATYGLDEEEARYSTTIGYAEPFYSLPQNLMWKDKNVTLLSATREGIITVKYQDTVISLKPKESWSAKRPPVIRNVSHGDGDVGCMRESVVTDTLYNAGIFDKGDIIATYYPR
jgi:hypothetical protein